NGTDDPLTESVADPVVIHNAETGAYMAFINQSGGGPATWIDRGNVCAEFITNWVMPKVQGTTRAGNPEPADGSTVDVNAPAVLRWSCPPATRYYEVYFGSDPEEVEHANTRTQGVYRGAQTGDMYMLSSPFVLGQIVYWRIDRVDTSGVRHKGLVWSFMVVDYVPVDEFESYDDSCNQIVYTWLDGSDHAPAPECQKAPLTGNGTGSLVGQGASPERKRTVVHSGVKSLELTYNNATEPYYSQIERIFSPAEDWTVFGDDVNTLTIWLRGDPCNAVQPLYVGIEDGGQRRKLVPHPNPQAVADSYWRAWDIPFTELHAGVVDIEDIRKMIIVVGDPTATQPGGSGKIYIDEIRLTTGGSAVRPVAQWAFDEGKGTTASDSAGWHDGTIVGALWSPGKTGTALWFDGINDYVDCGTDRLLNPAAMTLTFWVCPEHASMAWRFIVAKAGSGSSEVDYGIQMGGRAQVKGSFGDGSASVIVAGGKTVVTAEWVHLALTRDTTELTLYMDGANPTGAAHNIEPVDRGYPLRIGGPISHQGTIDDVRLYDRVLSPREIEQIAAGQL
ncbi:MAG: LamG domain-containing protein, partial [Planctomycetaceae bacterium]